MTYTHKPLPIGYTFKWRRKKYHVVQYVKDNDTDNLLIVLKVWSRGLKYWSYEVWEAWEYDINFRPEEILNQLSNNNDTLRTNP